MNAEKAALSYLHTFSDEVRDEADELRRSGAVKEIFGNFQAFQTRVRIGAQIFQCTFKFQDPKWVGTMNSKAESTAPLCASMQEYLHRAGELPATPVNDDDETFDDLVEKKLGRKLETKETDFLGKIEGRYTKWLQKGDVIDHDMVRLHPRWQVEGFDALSLWPAHEPPEDVFEFWNYCAYALVKKTLAWPPFMNAITDLEATRKRFSAWEQEAELARWRERTSKAVFDEVPPPLQSVAFRLQVTPRDARPQVQRGGEGSPWRALDFVSLREEDERGLLSFDPCLRPALGPVARPLEIRRAAGLAPRSGRKPAVSRATDRPARARAPAGLA